MHRLLRIALLGILLSGAWPAWGQSGPLPEQSRIQALVFRTWPPGATVTLLADGPQVLGRSGEPVLINVAKLQFHQTSFRLRFDLAGYRPRTETVRSYVFNDPGRAYPAPEQPPLRLEGTVPVLIDAWYLSRLHPFSAGLVGAVLALGLAIGVPAARARRRAERTSMERAERIERLLARADRTDPLVGAALGGYRVLERLGAGGMATVYRAVPDEALDEKDAVAVKVIARDVAGDPEFMRRFNHEVRACNALRHPSIVALYASGEQDGILFMAMELIRGVSLRTRVVEGGLPVAEAVAVLHPLMEAVAYAHGQGIVHRDLKPENVMIAADGRLKVMDFGLARGHRLSRITVTGTALGTPAYMAPEQITGGAVDARTDEYALGVVAYELLCGRTPFVADDPMALAYQHLAEMPPPLPGVVPGAVRRVVMRMLEKDPAARFRDVDEASDALRRATAP